MRVTPGGPDKHDDPHQRGAVRDAAEPLFVHKNHLETIKRFSIHVLYNNALVNQVQYYNSKREILYYSIF